MQLGLYVIYDKTAAEAGPVFQAVNQGIALRGAVTSLGGLPKALREEYSLYHIGYVNSKLMSVESMPAPVEIDMTLSFERSDAQYITEVKNV